MCARMWNEGGGVYIYTADVDGAFMVGGVIRADGMSALVTWQPDVKLVCHLTLCPSCLLVISLVFCL